jgi:hypothetical protein
VIPEDNPFRRCNGRSGVFVGVVAVGCVIGCRGFVDSGVVRIGNVGGCDASVSGIGVNRSLEAVGVGGGKR